MGKHEKEVLLSVKVSEELREKVYSYTQREGIKIKWLIRKLLEDFFSKDRKSRPS